MILIIKNKKLLVILGVILIICIALCVVTARDIDKKVMVMNNNNEWSYTVKTNIISKKATSSINDANFAHSSCARVGKNSVASGVVKPGEVANAKVKGYVWETAYTYWNVVG